MLVLAAATIALSGQHGVPPRSPAAVVQASATVRILPAARIRFGGKPDERLPRPRKARIRTSDGPQPAQLIEFE